MKHIYKYPLAETVDQIRDLKEMELPAGATLLTVQIQRKIPCIWAVVDDRDGDENKTKRVKRRFRTYGTGHPMEDAADFPNYVGTYQMEDGRLVFHVFADEEKL